MYFLCWLTNSSWSMCPVNWELNGSYIIMINAGCKSMGKWRWDVTVPGVERYRVSHKKKWVRRTALDDSEILDKTCIFSWYFVIVLPYCSTYCQKKPDLFWCGNFGILLNVKQVARLLFNFLFIIHYSPCDMAS